MNVLKASPSTEWCGYAPGYFPDNVVSYSAPNPSTFVITFNKSYDPEWFSTASSRRSPRCRLPGTGRRCPSRRRRPITGICRTRRSPARRLSTQFLDKQSKNLGSWATSPLWSVVDGPMKLQSFNSDGLTTLVPNPDWSGTPKPSIAKLVELPYTSETAIYNTVKSGGPSAVTIANVPSQYAPQLSGLEAWGTPSTRRRATRSTTSRSTSTPTRPSPGGEPVRYVFRQTYFRNALQHLVDQARLDPRVPVRHRKRDVRSDSACAAEPARRHLRDPIRPLHIRAVDGESAAVESRLEGGPRRGHHLPDPQPVRYRDQQGRGNLVQHRLRIGRGRGPGRDERVGLPGQEAGDHDQPDHAPVRHRDLDRISV